ncbi:MAG: hypothetical protein HY314_11795 [Acidobacteria bacterium]|nr:hypothetical protein [Acidobacteriota bacterium]
MNREPGYQGQVPLVTTPPEAVIIHCSDYRFQAAIHEFLQAELELRSYDVLAVPGGPHFASASDWLPKHFTVGKQNLRFLIEFHQLKRLILIDHSDCAFFKHRLAFFFSEPSMNDKQIANLRKARRVVQDWFPTLMVGAYFAEAPGTEPVRFIKIT